MHAKYCYADVSMPEDITFSGIVSRGDSRGRSLGFPTANLALNQDQDAPEAGIYACLATIGKTSQTYKAAMHIGPRPTFNDGRHIIEVHLLDFPDCDLYGEVITITEPTWIRPVGRFANAQYLAEEIKRDCERVRKIYE